MIFYNYTKSGCNTAFINYIKEILNQGKEIQGPNLELTNNETIKGIAYEFSLPVNSLLGRAVYLAARLGKVLTQLYAHGVEALQNALLPLCLHLRHIGQRLPHLTSRLLLSTWQKASSLLGSRFNTARHTLIEN